MILKLYHYVNLLWLCLQFIKVAIVPLLRRFLLRRNDKTGRFRL